MLLAVDIGNTTIKIGLLEGKRVRRIYQLETAGRTPSLKRRFDRLLMGIQGRYASPVEGAMICCVVPAVLKELLPVIKRRIPQKVVIVGRDVIVPIKNRYHNPRQVGQDRLVCSYAAQHLFGAPVIVVDLGTAITIDVVSSRKEYLGGVIVPGIRLSVESLSQKTALLPLVAVKRPPSVIGRDTTASILSGIFYGYGAMLSGLIDRISKRGRHRPTVVVTGGYAAHMKRYIVAQRCVVDNQLIFKGLQMLWNEFHSKE